MDKKNDYLAHHGIQGQKWGIRRYQNPDGTYTEEGLLRRYSKTDNEARKYSKKAFDESNKSYYGLNLFKVQDPIKLAYYRNRKTNAITQKSKIIEQLDNSNISSKTKKAYADYVNTFEKAVPKLEQITREYDDLYNKRNAEGKFISPEEASKYTSRYEKIEETYLPYQRKFERSFGEDVDLFVSKYSNEMDYNTRSNLVSDWMDKYLRDNR